MLVEEGLAHHPYFGLERWKPSVCLGGRDITVCGATCWAEAEKSRRTSKPRKIKRNLDFSKDLKKERRVSQWVRLLYGDFPPFLFSVFPKTENLKRCSDCIFNVWHCTTVVTAVLNHRFPLCHSACLSWAFCVMAVEKCMSNKLLIWRRAKKKKFSVRSRDGKNLRDCGLAHGDPGRSSGLVKDGRLNQKWCAAGPDSRYQGCREKCKKNNAARIKFNTSTV